MRRTESDTPEKGYQPKIVLQVHTAQDAVEGAKQGADAIVVQGTEAGGHGRSGSAMTTFCLVPQAAAALERYYASHASSSSTADRVSLLAAGGIADGRGLAAALMLGADGVVMGSRFVPTIESIAHINHKKRITQVATAPDSSSSSMLPTFRTKAADKLRQIVWPEGYDGRVLQNPLLLKTDAMFTQGKAPSQEEWENMLHQHQTAVEKWDYSDEGGAAIFVGQCVKQLGGKIEPAGDVLRHTVDEAQELLASASSRFL